MFRKVCFSQNIWYNVMLSLFTLYFILFFIFHVQSAMGNVIQPIKNMRLTYELLYDGLDDFSEAQFGRVFVVDVLY